MKVRQPMAWAALAALLAGCRPDVATQDAHDRETPLFRRALEREQVGDVDGAIRAYEETLLASPRLVSAHLHLALLLQDCRKDYMGAVYHYRQYDALRPNSEKRDLVKDRIHMSEQLLAAQLLNRGDVAVNRDQQKLIVEINRLNQRLSQTADEKAALLDQKGALEQKLADQKIELDRLRRLVDRLQLPGSADTGHDRSVLPRLDPAPSPTLPPRVPPGGSRA